MKNYQQILGIFYSTQKTEKGNVVARCVISQWNLLPEIMCQILLN